MYGDLETLLAKEKIDVADICTPTYLHAEMAIKCLEKGVHVLCEKPMTRRGTGSFRARSGFCVFRSGRTATKKAVLRPVKNNSSFITSTLLYGEESKFAGACVTCEASWYNADIPFCAEFFAVFDNGYLRLQGGVLTDNGKTVTFDSAAKKQDLGINVSGDDAYAEEIAYFLSCVKNDAPVTYVTPESALQTVRLTREIINNASV